MLVLETKFWEFESPLGHHFRKIGREVYCRCFESRSAGLSPARGFKSYIFRPFFHGVAQGSQAQVCKSGGDSARVSSNLTPVSMVHPTLPCACSSVDRAAVFYTEGRRFDSVQAHPLSFTPSGGLHA